jgi:endonuclease/exonuclease/phosphatase family metal-dependent hydrolase
MLHGSPVKRSGSTAELVSVDLGGLVIDRFERWWRRMQVVGDRHRWSARVLGLSSGTDGTRPDAPGLLLIQIDGLGVDQVERALAAGLLPNLARLQAIEPYRLLPVYSGLPSSTPAFQAELFYGERLAIPAYSFVRRDAGQVFRMSQREAAGVVEASLRGRGLLDGGSSYCNIYQGGASVTRFSMASLGPGDLIPSGRLRQLPALVAFHAVDLARLLASGALEVAVSGPQLVAAVRAGEPFRTEVQFLLARVGVVVVLREVLATLAAIDLARGLPIVHLNLLGYDEWAHRRGPDSPEATRALRDIDRVIGRLGRAAHRSCQRLYDVWVFSDHGQEATEPYVAVHGRPVADAIEEVLADHGIACGHAAEPTEGIQGLRAVMLGTRVARALSARLDLVPRPWDPTVATTTALGPLGHVYLPDPLPVERLAALAADVVRRADVPLVLAPAGPGAAHAWTATGEHSLPADAADILGADHPFLDQVTADLIGLCHHPDAGSLVISGWRPVGRPVSFPLEYGSHAGPGPRETGAFLFAPTDTPLTPPASGALRAADLRAAALHVLEGVTERPSSRWSRQPDRVAVRLLTYNVHSCVGLDGVISPERIARVIARYEPDVVALQELDVVRARTGGVDQAEAIARHLGMLSTFHAAYEMAEERFGDAVLSRLPLRLVKAGALPQLPGHPELEPRGALWVEIDAGDAAFQVVTTHLSLNPRERRAQAEALVSADWLGGVEPGANAVLCGDFNAESWFPTGRVIRRRLVDAQTGLDGHRPRRTWGGRLPLARIDHIFVDPVIRVVHVDVPATHLTRTASDHLPLYADLVAG